MGPFAFFVGGAVSGAMGAALNGAGLQGILMGAGMGAVLGGGLGGLSCAGYGLAAGIIGGGLLIGGGFKSYQQGGWEGVGDYAGAVIGGAIGFGAGVKVGVGLSRAMAGSPGQQSQAQAKVALETDQKPEIGPSKYRLKTNYDVEGRPRSFDLVPKEGYPQAGDKVYRVFDNNLHGSSWTPIDPRIVPDYTKAAGLYNKGGFLVEGTLQDTSGIMVRPALPGPNGEGGGLTEWVIPNSKTQVNVDKVYVYGLDK